MSNYEVAAFFAIGIFNGAMWSFTGGPWLAVALSFTIGSVTCIIWLIRKGGEA